MSLPLAEIPSSAAAANYIRDVQRHNLSYFTEKLVTEAWQDAYDLRTRSAFLVAVGAVALHVTENFSYMRPPYLSTARQAVTDYYGLEVVAAADNGMPYWQTWSEWDGRIRQACRAVRPCYEQLEWPEFSSIGCTVLLEHVQNQRAYIQLTDAMKC